MAELAFSVIPITITNGTGILTCFPSVTRFRLTLGADLPYDDERCVGNLRLSAWEILTPIIVTHVSILTSDTSSILPSTPSTAYRTLLYHAFKKRIRSFGVLLSPGTSSAQADLTSELLRFL